MESRKALIDYVIGNEFISKPELQHKFINLLNKHEKSLQLQQTNFSEEEAMEEEPKQLNSEDFGLPKIRTKEFNDLASALFGGKPKQDFILVKEDCTCTDECMYYLSKQCKHLKEEPKQETLEEVKKYAELSYYGDEVDAFVRGVKWQKEQDNNKYSDEDVIELLKTFDEKFNSGIVERNKGINNWFEQFKKK